MLKCGVMVSQAVMQLSDAQKRAVVAAHREMMAELNNIYANFQEMSRTVSIGLSSPYDRINRVRRCTAESLDARTRFLLSWQGNLNPAISEGLCAG